MGTALTGTTPQDTYDSLIKVTDNGPISGSLKVLSDGLGNDSTLSLSTTAASIAGTLAVTGNLTIDTSTLVVDAANNRVGIGTAAPTHNLTVGTASPSDFVIALRGGVGGFLGWDDSANATILQSPNTRALVFQVNSDTFSGGTEAMRITPTGNVGIGTSTPSYKFVVSNGGAEGVEFAAGSASNLSEVIAYNRSTAAWNTIRNSALAHEFYVSGTERVRVTADGLTFNGDTAAANALDDYEEGTWTPTTLTAGYTISASNGSYTKIGRQVTIRGQFTFSARDYYSQSQVTIAGLPFTNSASIFSGLARESTTTGVIYSAIVLASSTGVFVNSMDGVTSGSNRVFATSENYVLAITYFV